MANAANTSVSTLQKRKALLQEVVTELNSSSSNSKAVAPRRAVTCRGAGSQVSDSIHNEHQRLFGFQYHGGGRGRYNPFSTGGTQPLKASKSKRQPTWTKTFACLPNKCDAFPLTFAEYAQLKKAGLGDRKIILNLDYGPLEVDEKLKQTFPKLEDSIEDT